ncbi:hypothetical protein Q5H92_08830 [Hymenobacter sp. M29]|uniref:Uncharacterized protein n=1 Tax=Hymenobacter mellowenesis TaxID=3063995 RepID=A0ABT9A9E0_9BACT|nr:hypothetical protein [Hymenobacter sp. M29]MDO7846459.1 hypothetical protein [Hymenobacter sp. M29]
MESTFDFSKRFTPKRKLEFAQLLKSISRQIGFKVSSRGWCYIMEQKGLINKDQFDRVADAINDLRRQGMIPVDFVAEESARQFQGVEEEYDGDVDDVIGWMTRDVLNGGKYFTPDWWEDEEYYIQCVVEKIDLVTLFAPVCEKFKIPIANSKGWSSILQRAEYARRFKEAEDKGLKCVLLYCGDHDPDGKRISETLRNNLEQVSEVTWGDGTDGYDPADLIIDRFGLNYDFIKANGFTWIDNLITGSGGNLASPRHPNHSLPYVQEYLRTIGERKCEANAIVTLPRVARAMVRQAIEKYLGEGAEQRFEEKMQARKDEYNERLKEIGLYDIITDFQAGRNNEDEDDE